MYTFQGIIQDIEAPAFLVHYGALLNLQNNNVSLIASKLTVEPTGKFTADNQAAGFASSGNSGAGSGAAFATLGGSGYNVGSSPGAVKGTIFWTPSVAMWGSNSGDSNAGGLIMLFEGGLQLDGNITASTSGSHSSPGSCYGR